ERAEVHNARHRAGVVFPDFHFLYQRLDDPLRLLARVRIGGGDEYPAVVLDVNGHAGLVDDLVDDLAAWPDDFPDFVHWDRQRDDARRVRRHLAPRLGEHLQHAFQDKQPARPRLLEGLSQNLPGDAADLDVHLQGGDAVFGSGHFEVHIAQSVLDTLDVAEDGETVFVLDQTHRDARHGLADGQI